MINSLTTAIEAEFIRQEHASILTDRDKIILDAVNKKFRELEEKINKLRKEE